MFYYFKKGKNATEMEKKVAQWEGAVTECVKSGLWSFVLEDSSLHDAPQSGRPVEVYSDQIEMLRTINIIPRRRQSTYSKYPNQ